MGISGNRRPCLRSVEFGTVVEQWWCPVCNAAAHRVFRPGRPRIYCSNACRQRAYRFRRDHGLRTTATVEAPTEAGLIWSGPGKRHSLRARRDFMSQLSDRNRRRVTVCGLLARPARHTKLRHYDFYVDSPSSCRSCVALVTPPGAPPLPPYGPEVAGSLMTRPRTHVPGSPATFDDEPSPAENPSSAPVPIS